MSLQRSFIEDVIDVIREIKLISSGGEMNQKLPAIRKVAVRTVATRELGRRRFSNFDSAEKLIHDACSRRLHPSVTNIGDFDVAVEQWLSGNPERLRSILLSKADNAELRNEFETLLHRTDSQPITPLAADIREPLEPNELRLKLTAS